MTIWEALVYYSFILEVFIILSFLIILPIHRIFIYIEKFIQEKIKKKINEQIIKNLQTKNYSKGYYFLKYAGEKNVLISLEAFDKRFQGGDWQDLKAYLCKNLLLPYARKKAYSGSWIKRNFAARSFALFPTSKDEDVIFDLLNDKQFLVRSMAAIAILRLGHKAGVYSVIRRMSMERGYARFFYRDILLQQSNEVYNLIKEIAGEFNEYAIHLACLELLCEKSIVKVPDYVKRDLKSNDTKIRMAAVKILVNNPQKDNVELLSDCLLDFNDKIRAQAVKGLQYFPSKEVFEKLEDALKDRAWLVRLNAAQTLKRMGKQGLEILKSQNEQENKEAYDVAQAVLQMDW